MLKEEKFYKITKIEPEFLLVVQKKKAENTLEPEFLPVETIEDDEEGQNGIIKRGTDIALYTEREKRNFMGDMV